MSYLFAIAAAFVTTTIEDPITQDQLHVFAASDHDNLLSLSCKPGSNSLEIRVVPDRYYGASGPLFFWAPRGDSRFGKSEKPMTDSWFFGESFIAFDDSKMGSNRRKAEFLHQLASDDVFHLRYEARRGRTETISIQYELDQRSLSDFIATCNPRRVIEYLREWDSPAAL